MEKKKSIIIIRVLAMISIICCHIFQELGNDLAYWFNVGVQIFIFTSGFLYGNKKIENKKEFAIKRIKKILIPYYIYLIVIFIYYYIFKFDYINIRLVIKTLLGLQIFGKSIKGIGHLWFVPLIMICYAITPFLQYCYEKLKNLKESLFWSIVIIFLFILQTFILIPYISFDITMNIAIYILGLFISKKYNEKQIDIKQLKVILLVSLIFSIILSIIKIYFTNFQISSPYNKIISNIVVYKNLFIGITFFLFIYILGEENKFFNKEYKIFNILDKYSYYIYITHLLFILGPSSMLYITPNIIVNCIIILVLVYISAVLLEYITNKVNVILEKITQIRKVN